MEKAILAKQVIKRLVERTEDGRSIMLHTIPDMTDLPDWVEDAWNDGLFIMSENDGYTGLWIVTPYGFAMRAEPDDLLLRRGEFVGLWQ